jgi:hypothetical protein
MTTPHDWEAPGGQPPGEPPPQPGSHPQPGSFGHPGQPADPGQPNYPPPGYPAQPGNPGPPSYSAYPGYLPTSQPWPPPASYRPRLNGFAVASLVLGILSGSLLAIIFGVIALRQINSRGDRGRGMAIAGIILGSIWLLLVVVAIASGAWGSGTSS